MGDDSARRVYIGFDPREVRAFQVCQASIIKHASIALNIEALELHRLRERRLYWRPHEYRDGQLWDVASDQPMSTQFAISRFLVPTLAEYQGWAVFCDCDFLWRADIAELFALADPQYALMVVKHCYLPGMKKMDDQINVVYPRKNWSSLMLWNCAHPSNRRLTPEMVNTRHRRDLHTFCWLHDWEIGQLPFEWNWLDLEPKAVHMTSGTPEMPGYENVRYADEWRSYE